MSLILVSSGSILVSLFCYVLVKKVKTQMQKHTWGSQDLEQKATFI